MGEKAEKKAKLFKTYTKANVVFYIYKFLYSNIKSIPLKVYIPNSKIALWLV